MAAAGAGLVAEASIPVDGALVEAAALLHDIDKVEIRRSGGEHGVVGARQLEAAGFAELAMPVASHPLHALLDDDRFPIGWPSVLVAVADRHVAQEFVTVDERLDDMRHPASRARRVDRGPRGGQRMPSRRELAEAAGLSVDELVARLRAAWEAARDRALLLVHGDDGFGLDAAVPRLRDAGRRDRHGRDRAGAQPRRGAIDRAQLEAGTMGMFGAHLAVLRQPLKAAGRSTAATDRLVALVTRPARRLARWRCSRSGRPGTSRSRPRSLQRLAEAVTAARRAGRGARRPAARRAAWLDPAHAARIGVTDRDAGGRTCWPSESAAASGRPTSSAAR